MKPIELTAKRIVCLAAFSAFAVLGPGTPLRAQTVAVMVNGEPITSFDIEQRTRLTKLSTHKVPSRQEVIDELIDEKLKIKEGKKYGVNPTSSNVDSSFAQMGSRMHLSPEQLTQSLASQGIRVDTLKSRIKADIVWGSLIRGRFKDSLLVSEKDIEAALRRAGDEPSKTEGFEYQMRPVVLIVPHGAAPGVFEARRKEAEALRERVDSCAQANDMFKVMQNATIRDTVVKSSADVPPQVREVLDKTPIGHLTPPETTRQGIEMAVICGKKPISVDTPKKKEFREKMFAEKYDQRSKAYIAELRRGAMIEYPHGAPEKKTN